MDFHWPRMDEDSMMDFGFVLYVVLVFLLGLWLFSD